MKEMSTSDMKRTQGGFLFELLAVVVLVAGVVLGITVGAEIGSWL